MSKQNLEKCNANYPFGQRVKILNYFKRFDVD